MGGRVLPGMQSPPISQSISRRGDRKACQPCSHRKVRCDKAGAQPCSNCVRRKQPELCDMGSQSRSRARPHGANSPRSKSLLLERRAARTASEQNELGRSTTQHNLHSTSPSGSRRMSASGSARSGTAISDQVQSPNLSGGTPTPLHIGDSAMANFIRHQADSTGFRLNDSLTSMLGLQNCGAAYPLLDLGASEDRWRELEPILPSPNEIWRLVLPSKLAAPDSWSLEAFTFFGTACKFLHR